jgi:hypothetical protein
MSDERCFQVTNSKQNSLNEYEYCGERIIRSPMMLKLKNIKTGSVKYFRVEYVKKTKGGYIVKNANNTIFLKRK